MAHWNEIRDEWRVEEARLCNSQEIVRKFEETGDEIYWAQFIELLRADESRTQRLRDKPLLDTGGSYAADAHRTGISPVPGKTA